MAFNEDTSAFAERVGILRANLGLSFDAVGAAVGVSGETIRRYEHGLSAPRGRRLVTRLEVALDARPGELWTLLRGAEPTSSDDDTDGPLLDALRLEVRELWDVVDELRRQRRDEPPEARRRDRREDRVPQAS